MSLLGELIAQVVGETAIKALRGPRQARPPVHEGETKASYGAAAAFFGTLGVLFALPIALLAALEGPSPGMSMGALLGVTAVGLAVSICGIRLGARAPLVAHRNLGMAKFGLVAGVAGALSSIVALLACAARAIL